MKPRAGRFNPKRRVMAAMERRRLQDVFAERAGCVRYGGNPEHKRHPGDFGLTPPAAARLGKTLCDGSGIERRSDALALLREGLRRGLVNADWSGDGWPRNVWAVSGDGVPFEAQSEAAGVYHGYPMPDGDGLADHVLNAWRAAP